MKKKFVLLVVLMVTLCAPLVACGEVEVGDYTLSINENKTVDNPNLKRVRNNEQVDLLKSDEYGSIRLAIETELNNAVVENGGTRAIVTNMIGYLNTDDAFVKGWVTSVVGSESYSGYFEVEVYLDTNDNVTSMNWITIE